jgi:hypothetical protein
MNAFSSLRLHSQELMSMCIDLLMNRSSTIPSYPRSELTTLGEWHVEHSARLSNNSESPRMSDEHAIAKWYKSSN